MRIAASLRKVITVMMCIGILFSMTGCFKQEHIEADSSEAVITVDIDAVEDKIYRLDLVYFLEDELMGGQAVSYVDESPLKGTQVFRLTGEDFPEGSLREGFSFYIVVSGDKNGINELISSAEIIGNTNYSDTFTAVYGCLYAYSIKGSFEKGFTLERNAAE